MKRKSFPILRVLVVAMHVSASFIGTHIASAAGKLDLPAPTVSRALDAILLPINPKVAKAFKLGKGRKGVLVVAVQPGGVADKQGIKAGDVLSVIDGRPIRRPLDVDVSVRRHLKKGDDKFEFGAYRAGSALSLAAIITLELYNETISFSDLSSWSSWSESTSFSYSEFVSTYSESITSSYSSEESIVESEVSTEEVDTDNDGTPDAEDADDDNDGTPDADDNDDDNDGTDDAAEDGDGTADGEDADGDNDGVDDTDGDDQGDDADGGGDEGGDDDGGGDDGGDDGGGDDE